MTPHLVTMPVTGAIADAVDIIVNKNIGGIPITDAEGELKGIVTERDVMKVLATENSGRKAEDIMNSSVRVTGPDTPIGKVCREMVKCRFRRFPVVADDVLCGIVTATDIMSYLGKGKAFEQLTTGGDSIEVMGGVPVRSLLSGGELHTITPDRNIHEIALEMIRRRVGGALPVIEDSHLVGLVTEYDLVKAFSEE